MSNLVLNPHSRRIGRSNTIWWIFCWSIFIISAILHSTCAEIKFIPVNRVQKNMLGDSADIHSNKVDRSHEPLALESAVVATVDLSPSSSSNGTRDETPSIHSSPVLQFHTQDLDYDDDNSNEDGDETNNEESEEEDAEQSLVPTKRHRRRLMLLQGRNGREVSLPTTTSTSTSTSTTLRPPKDFIIYALPEQSFWAKNKKGKRGKNSKVPSTPHLDEDASTLIPLSGEDEEDVEQERQIHNQTPLSTTNFNYFEETVTPNSGYNISSTETSLDGINARSASTSTPAPTTTEWTTTSTTTSTTPSPAETLKMTLAEKKFHLGQCMRYCMDAIL